MITENYINDEINVLKKVLEDKIFISTLDEITKKVIDTYKNNNKVLLAGNGGSAADAQHIASELVSKMFINRKGLCAFSLTSNTSVMTSISNDYGYENVFSKQIEATGCKGDIFIGISTSGKSENIMRAFETAKQQGLITVGLSGEIPFDRTYCDFVLSVPSNCTPIIQEVHIMAGHILCAKVEEYFYGEK